MAGCLHGIFASVCCFVPPRRGFPLSLLCNDPGEYAHSQQHCPRGGPSTALPPRPCPPPPHASAVMRPTPKCTMIRGTLSEPLPHGLLSPRRSPPSSLGVCASGTSHAFVLPWLSPPQCSRMHDHNGRCCQPETSPWRRHSTMPFSPARARKLGSAVHRDMPSGTPRRRAVSTLSWRVRRVALCLGRAGRERNARDLG